MLIRGEPFLLLRGDEVLGVFGITELFSRSTFADSSITTLTGDFGPPVPGDFLRGEEPFLEISSGQREP